MTTLADAIPVDRLQGQATQARPGRVIATVITAVFVGVGWVPGALWRSLAFIAVSVRYGWLRGRGLTDEDIAARAAARAAPAPAPPPPGPRA